MSTTRYKLIEQIRRRIATGDPSSAFTPAVEEIREAINQVINSTLKTQFYTETLAGGETIPEGHVLAYYENVAVTTWNGISKSVLPAFPVKLPRNMGVYTITKTNDPFTSFIPVPTGQISFVQAQRGMSDLLGQIGYEVRGKEVWYNKDLLAQSPAVTAVNMQLVVMDISRYNDYEPLPVQADMEELIIEQVAAKWMGQAKKPQVNDTTTDRV